MHAKNAHPWLVIFVMALSLTGCANYTTTGHSTAPLWHYQQETADLSVAVKDALNLVKQVGSAKVLVVFDIDNTLLAMEQGLGADQWYEWQKTLANETPCDPAYVGDRFAVQGALYFASAMRPTQPDAPVLVQRLQDQGIPVIALTSRGPDYRLQTFRELRRNGFSFIHTAIGPPGGYPEAFVPVEGGRWSRYEDGVFLTAGQHKGQMLHALLQKTGFGLPAAIVMADDKQKNLDAVAGTFRPMAVPVRAWRYAGEDNNVKSFDPEQADTQWQAIKDALWQIQQVLGPDNYDLAGAGLSPECIQ